MYKIISLILFAFINSVAFAMEEQESTPDIIDHVGVAKNLIMQAKHKFDKAYACLKRADSEGDNEAKYTLGKIYYSQFWGKHNRHKAKVYFEEAAAHGHAGAQYRLGCLYDDDARLAWQSPHVVPPPPPSPYPQSAYDLHGSWHLYYSLWARAEAYYKLASRQNYTKAYGPLSSLYSFACGVPKDSVAAKMFLELAYGTYPSPSTDKNFQDQSTSYRRARHLLSKTKTKFNDALACLEEAVKLDNREAMIVLAKIYRHKQWGLNEISSAYNLLTIAASLNSVAAYNDLGKLFRAEANALAYRESIDEQQNRIRLTLAGRNPTRWLLLGVAADYFRMGAKREHPKAQRNLALAYLEGLGVRQDDILCMRFLKLSVVQGDLKAKLLLASEYERYAPYQNYRLAAEIRQSIPLEKQSSFDILCFATLYDEGKGVEQDYRQATELYQYCFTCYPEEWAAEQSCMRLSELYRTGQGVPLDLAKAAQYSREE